MFSKKSFRETRLPSITRSPVVLSQTHITGIRGSPGSRSKSTGFSIIRLISCQSRTVSTANDVVELREKIWKVLTIFWERVGGSFVKGRRVYRYSHLYAWAAVAESKIIFSRCRRDGKTSGIQVPGLSIPPERCLITIFSCYGRYGCPLPEPDIQRQDLPLFPGAECRAGAFHRMSERPGGRALWIDGPGKVTVMAETVCRLCIPAKSGESNAFVVQVSGSRGSRLQRFIK